MWTRPSGSSTHRQRRLRRSEWGGSWAPGQRCWGPGRPRPRPDPPATCLAASSSCTSGRPRSVPSTAPCMRGWCCLLTWGPGLTGPVCWSRNRSGATPMLEPPQRAPRHTRHNQRAISHQGPDSMLRPGGVWGAGKGESRGDSIARKASCRRRPRGLREVGGLGWVGVKW